MLAEKITNPWFRFKIYFKSLTNLDEMVTMAKSTFLFIVAHYDSYKTKKLAMLEEVVNKCPEVLSCISDSELWLTFEQLVKSCRRRHTIICVSEMKWISKYVDDVKIRSEMEKIIWKSQLTFCCFQMESLPELFDWTISREDSIQLVRDLLQSDDIGVERKMELAIAFDEPAEKYIHEHYSQLLYNREYDEAEKLQVVKAEDATVNVVAANVCCGYFREALAITERFIPHRKDIVQEIQQIQSAFES